MYAVITKNHANQERKTLATYSTKGEANRALRKIAKELDPQGVKPWVSYYDKNGFTVPASHARMFWTMGTVDYMVDRV